MQKFVVNDLDEIKEVVPGEVLEFDAGSRGRDVKLQITATEVVGVWATKLSQPDERKLIASAQGVFKVEVSTDEPLFLEFSGSETVAIFLVGFTRDQRVLSEEKEKFTNIEPRSRRNTNQDRMIMLSKLNEKRRDAILAEQMARLDALTAAKIAEIEERTNVIEEPVVEPLVEPLVEAQAVD